MNKKNKDIKKIINFNNKPLIRQIIVFILSLSLLYLFWASRPNWTFDMRFWRAAGDVSFILLWISLLLGPLGKISKKFIKYVVWRRAVGIWAAIYAFLHTYLILNGWIGWDYMWFFGFQYMPELGRYSRIEPGFGLANLLGIVALVFMLILLAVSSNKAIQYLGPKSWKLINYSAHIIFYLIIIHIAYFMFINYNPTFHRPSNYILNWFAYPFLLISLSVPILRSISFYKEVKKYRKSLKN